MPDTVEKLFKVNKQGITVIRETVRPVKAAQVNNEAAKREVTAFAFNGRAVIVNKGV